MSSFQSPEGLSTHSLPQILGKRKAAEVLMLDQKLTAQDALKHGLVNEIIDGLGDSDWFDPMKIPAIKTLLASDYRTIVNMKRLMIRAQN